MPQSLEAFTGYKSAINTALDEVFQQFPASFAGELSKPSQIALEHLREYSLRPGKRIRGSLAAAAYDEASGSQLGLPGIRLGVALELMQNYLLIVDDVMDKSATRRGLPTVHELYMQSGDDKTDLHEAQMMAINVGEVAQHMANLVLTELDDVEPAYVQAALHQLHTNILVTGFGQIDDLHQQLGRKVSEADILRKYRSKSSYYTFINPLQCGFTLAGQGTATALQACRDFGLPAGVAFQLHDDMLGVFADSKTLGKPNLDDIREGKYTLLVHYALQHADTKAVAKLETILGNPAADENDLGTIRHILTESGAKDFVAATAASHADAARAILATQTSWSTGFRQTLDELLTFSITRTT